MQNPEILARKHQTFFKVLSENSSILQGHTLSEHPLCHHIIFSYHRTISICCTRSKWRPCSALRIRGSLQSEAHLLLTLQDSPFHSIVMLPHTAETSPWGPASFTSFCSFKFIFLWIQSKSDGCICHV